MRRIFYGLGIVFTALIVVAFGLVGFAAYKGSGLDSESKAYVDRAVIDVGTKWDTAELLKRASPDLLTHSSPDQLKALFQTLGGFGALVHYDGSEGQATMSASIGSGSTVRAHYDANATFKNGPAHFRIDLSKRDDRWMIDGFFVDITPPGSNAKAL